MAINEGHVGNPLMTLAGGLGAGLVPLAFSGIVLALTSQRSYAWTTLCIVSFLMYGTVILRLDNKRSDKAATAEEIASLRSEVARYKNGTPLPETTMPEVPKGPTTQSEALRIIRQAWLSTNKTLNEELASINRVELKYPVANLMSVNGLTTPEGIKHSQLTIEQWRSLQKRREAAFNRQATDLTSVVLPLLQDNQEDLAAFEASIHKRQQMVSNLTDSQNVALEAYASIVDFAVRNRDNLTVDGDQLMFPSDELLDEFNALQRASQEGSANVRRQVLAFDQQRNESLQKIIDGR